MYQGSPLRSSLNTNVITGLGMCTVCAGQGKIDKGTHLPAVEASCVRAVTACPREQQQQQQQRQQLKTETRKQPQLPRPQQNHNNNKRRQRRQQQKQPQRQQQNKKTLDNKHNHKQIHKENHNCNHKQNHNKKNRWQQQEQEQQQKTTTKDKNKTKKNNDQKKQLSSNSPHQRQATCRWTSSTPHCEPSSELSVTPDWRCWQNLNLFEFCVIQERRVDSFLIRMCHPYSSKNVPLLSNHVGVHLHVFPASSLKFFLFFFCVFVRSSVLCFICVFHCFPPSFLSALVFAFLVFCLVSSHQFLFRCSFFLIWSLAFLIAFSFWFCLLQSSFHSKYSFLFLFAFSSPGIPIGFPALARSM